MSGDDFIDLGSTPEVTQADRDVAASVAVLVEMRELIRAGKADHHAEPFARHRQQASEYWYRQGKDDGAQQERQSIIDWLASNAAYDMTDLEIQVEIENGEHLK